MFASPPEAHAAVHAELGDAWHYPEGVESPWLALQRPGQRAASFIEGPAFDRQGRLWFADIPWGRLFRVGQAGQVELVTQYDGEPNGLAFHRDGRLFIADHRHGILAMDPDSLKITPVVQRYNGDRFKGVNDLVFARNGDLYFTDQGQSGLHDPSGRLLRLTAQGRLECLLEHIPSPNGLVLDAAERSVLLAVTRHNAIWRVPLLPQGGVTKVGVFIRLSGGSGPDGLAIDRDDNLVVCHLGLGTVWVFDAGGEPLRRIRSPRGRLATNAAFGGPDGRTLYVTESETGAILSVPMDVPGQPMYAHA